MAIADADTTTDSDIARQRRDEFLKAAEAIIATEGLPRLSLGQIERRAGMSRGHMEIRRMIQTLRGLRTGLDTREPTEAERYAIERHLHGLLAITRLHFAQEDEIYRALEAA